MPKIRATTRRRRFGPSFQAGKSRGVKRGRGARSRASLPARRKPKLTFRKKNGFVVMAPRAKGSWWVNSRAEAVGVYCHNTRNIILQDGDRDRLLAAMLRAGWKVHPAQLQVILLP